MLATDVQVETAQMDYVPTIFGYDWKYGLIPVFFALLYVCWALYPMIRAGTPQYRIGAVLKSLSVKNGYLVVKKRHVSRPDKAGRRTWVYSGVYIKVDSNDSIVYSTTGGELQDTLVPVHNLS